MGSAATFRPRALDFTRTLFDVIDMRSFSNLWFWIVVAVVWSSASYFVLGVPYDMIVRARRLGGQHRADFEAMVRISVNRILYLTRTAGIWLLGFAAFMLTALLILGFWYWVEFAQAVVLIALPMSLVGAMSVARARAIEAEAPTGEALVRQLLRHRRWTQVIGMVALFVTAMFGTYENLTALRVPGW